MEVPWPKGRPTLAKLERAVRQGAMAAGRKALVSALGAWEQELSEAGARQRRVRRYLLTRVGPIRFHRWKTRKDGRYGFPLDQAMGLRPWQTCSGFVWERACRLAGSHPFRQAARLLSDLVGTPVDTHTIIGVASTGRTQEAFPRLEFVNDPDGLLGHQERAPDNELSLAFQPENPSVGAAVIRCEQRLRASTDCHDLGDAACELIRRGIREAVHPLRVLLGRKRGRMLPHDHDSKLRRMVNGGEHSGRIDQDLVGKAEASWFTYSEVDLFRCLVEGRYRLPVDRIIPVGPWRVGVNPFLSRSAKQRTRPQ